MSQTIFKKYYDVKDAGKYLCCKPKYVLHLVKEGKLQGKKFCGSYRFTQEQLDACFENLEDSNSTSNQMNEQTRNQLRYHGKLRSKESTPNMIQRMSERILGIKADLEQLDDLDRKVPVVAKLRSTISAREANRKKLEAVSDHLPDFADEVYPGLKELVDEAPDTLEEIFTQEAQGGQEGHHKTLQAGAEAGGSGEKESKSMTGYYHEQMESGE